MTTVETVLGPIEASELGFVLSHEHVFTSNGNENYHYPWRYDWERSKAFVSNQLREAKAGGVDAIIDLTTPDLGRDVEYVREVAKRCDVHIIVATGIWRDVPAPFHSRDPDESADIFVREIEIGIGNTDIRAGAIKVANDIGGVQPHHESVLRGAARALKRTGTPISTHHWAPEEVGRQQVAIFLEEGAPMDRVCIGHSADSTDVAYLEDLLQTGVYLSMDRYPGREGRPNWEQRNETVRALIDHGWASRLMLGHDYAPALILEGREPAEKLPGQARDYLFITNTAIPGLLEAGVDQDTIDRMMRENPRRFLTGED